eukprot:scaffold5458_cov131-Isochrysis_galbana.AAC.1
MDEKPNADYTGAGDEGDGTEHITTESEFKVALDEYIDMYREWQAIKDGKSRKAHRRMRSSCRHVLPPVPVHSIIPHPPLLLSIY